MSVDEISNENFIIVNYTCNSEVSDKKRPQVTQWRVSRFERNKMEMTFNFSNPLYISTGSVPDSLEITIVENLIFRSAKNQSIEPGFTSQKEIPS